MLELNKALKELSANESAKMFFWYSEKGTKGKPTVLASKSSDTKKDEALKAILEDPNFKLAAQGSMKIQPAEGVLVLKPKGKAPSAGALEKGAFMAVLNAHAGMFVKRVAVGDAGDEGPEEESETGAEAATSGPAVKAVPAALKETQERDAATK